MYYSPWKENRFGGIEDEAYLRKQGYIRTEESATCMVQYTAKRIFMFFFQLFILNVYLYIYICMHTIYKYLQYFLDRGNFSDVYDGNNYMDDVLRSLHTADHCTTSDIL